MNKYWLGDEFTILKFCESDLKTYYHDEFASKTPNANYSWDKVIAKAIYDPSYEDRVVDYIRNLRHFFGEYFPELHEFIVEHE